MPDDQKNASASLAGVIHARITDLLKREVVLMREILSNMCEEELAFIDKDPKALQNVMHRRNAPLEALTQVREERNEELKQLTQLLDPKWSASGSTTLAMLMEEKGLEGFEVELLQEQIIALAEKMNLQRASNEHLMSEAIPLWKEMMAGELTAYHPLKEQNSGADKRKAPALEVIHQDGEQRDHV